MMAATAEAMPELVLKKSDGSLLTRIEAEQELWDKCKTSHMMRRLAWGRYGLDHRFTWVLKPTSVTHWLLDELVRKKLIAGDPLGVQPELESDDSYFNSYIQRLRVFVEEGRALAPKEGEGINMSEFQNPGPGPMMPPNGQPPMPGYAPPQGFPPQAPPMGAPQFQQQPPQVAPPQPGFPPQMPQQPMAPQAPPGFPPQAPQFGAPQGAPQFGAPQMAPPTPGFPPQQGMPAPGAPPQMAPQGAPPAPPAQAPANRRGRGKAEAAPPGALPSQQPLPMAAPPQGAPIQGFGAPPAMPQFGAPQGAPPQQFAPQQMGAPIAAPQAAGGSDPAIGQLKAMLEEQGKLLQAALGKISGLERTIKALDIVASLTLRGYYGAPAIQTVNDLGTEVVFKLVNLPYPT